MKRIKQRKKTDCVIACLAMLTGHTYDAVLAHFPPAKRKDGVYDGDLLSYLIEHNVNFQVNVDREDVCEGDLVIGATQDDGPRHAMMVEENGRVFDPAMQYSEFEDFRVFFYSVRTLE